MYFKILSITVIIVWSSNSHHRFFKLTFSKCHIFNKVVLSFQLVLILFKIELVLHDSSRSVQNNPHNRVPLSGTQS